MRTVLKSLVITFIGCCVICGWSFAQTQKEFSTKPRTNNGKKWRIGYYEGGPYIDYKTNLIATINGLMKLGWIQPADIPDDGGKYTDKLWAWLSKNAKSDYIEFPADAYYSAGWKDNVRAKLRQELIHRLNTKKDLDLIIAMGTKAGLDIAVDKHHVPTMVLSTSDPIGAGIIKSVEDSGLDHVSARVDLLRYERQVREFHDIVGFSKLGIVYRDDETGRSIAALDKVEKVAKERGFEIVSCLIPPGVDLKTEEKVIVECYKDLSKKCDAIYVAIAKGINKNTIGKLVKITTENHIPTFSQAGSHEVRQGFLLSISVASYKYVGQYYAEKIAKVFNGALPRKLNQVFEDPPKFAINLKTAEMIGFNPQADILNAADEIYETIEVPK